MQIHFANEWPDELRDALTTGLIGKNVRINLVDYRIDGYDVHAEQYQVRCLCGADEPAADAPAMTLSFLSVDDILVY